MSYRIGMIGTDGHVNMVLDGIPGIEGASLCACAKGHPEDNVDRLRKHPAFTAGTTCYETHEEMLAAEDLDIVIACLRRLRERDDLPYIGLIGSKTKWATFSHRLEARGFTAAELARVTCPIGVPGITGKEPEVIAVAVAAQLLQSLG